MAVGRQPAGGAPFAQCTTPRPPAVPQTAVIQVCQVLSSSRRGWWRAQLQRSAHLHATPKYWGERGSHRFAEVEPIGGDPSTFGCGAGDIVGCLALHGHFGEQLASDAQAAANQVSGLGLRAAGAELDRQPADMPRAIVGERGHGANVPVLRARPAIVM